MRRSISQCKFLVKNRNASLQKQNSMCGQTGRNRVEQNYGVNQKMILKTLAKSKTEFDSLVPKTTANISIFETTSYSPTKENDNQPTLTENEKALRKAKKAAPNFNRTRRTREDRKGNKLNNLLVECQALVNSRTRKSKSITATRPLFDHIDKPTKDLKGIKHLVRRYLSQLYSKIPLKIKIQENNRKHIKDAWTRVCNI